MSLRVVCGFQHADALSSMRLELQRAHTEEIRRLQQEVENERKNDRQELEEEKKQVQQKMEEEKVRLKEQLRKALEEVIRKHASELRHAHAMLDAEKKKTQQVQQQVSAAVIMEIFHVRNVVSDALALQIISYRLICPCCL